MKLEQPGSPARQLQDKLYRRFTCRSRGPENTQISASRARTIAMKMVRSLGFESIGREFEKFGYDIESRIPGGSKLRFTDTQAGPQPQSNSFRREGATPTLTASALATNDLAASP